MAPGLTDKPKILVLCTGNSCRSQMAEGYLRKFAGDRAEVFSAGVMPHGVNTNAIAVMKEDGIDISMQTSNHVDEYRDLRFDFVITVCDNAREQCPVFPSATRQLHRDFPDPAGASGSHERIMGEFRSVRNMIREYCADFVAKNISR